MQIWLNGLFIISETGKSSPSVLKVTFDPYMFLKHPQQPRAETTVHMESVQN